MGKPEKGSAINPPHSSSPCQLSTRESCCFLYRVNDNKVARVPYPDSPCFPGVHIFCRARIICSSHLIIHVMQWYFSQESDVLAPGWLTVCSLLVEAMGLSPFPALVCHLFVCIALFVCFCQSTCFLNPSSSLGRSTEVDVRIVSLGLLG